MPNLAVWIASIFAFVPLANAQICSLDFAPAADQFPTCTLAAFRRPKGKRIFTCAVPAVASQCQLLSTLIFDRVAQEYCSFQVVWISYPSSPIGYKSFQLIEFCLINFWYSSWRSIRFHMVLALSLRTCLDKPFRGPFLQMPALQDCLRSSRCMDVEAQSPTQWPPVA